MIPDQTFDNISLTSIGRYYKHVVTEHEVEKFIHSALFQLGIVIDLQTFPGPGEYVTDNMKADHHQRHNYQSDPCIRSFLLFCLLVG